ncbi:hypothetical protein C4K38_2584 [Pseudomonas chlororaphis subsp. piscium]|nr:hypothetical protein C4K38_2584 [Pseudomonas chlororaphis subsp. piscium]SDT15338.1 hypothetical protein SAMN05216585_4791 [Pseudomonas chlororaphis]
MKLAGAGRFRIVEQPTNVVPSYATQACVHHRNPGKH